MYGTKIPQAHWVMAHQIQQVVMAHQFEQGDSQKFQTRLPFILTVAFLQHGLLRRGLARSPGAPINTANPPQMAAPDASVPERDCIAVTDT
jgi:hypothetical protein